MQGEAERDERLMMLVETALALPPHEREAFFQSTATVDPDLYEEVRNRVEWEERMGGFLRDPVVAPEGAAPFEAGELVAGRFRILRELGRGGMGVVYQATDEKLDRSVAMKCARPGYHARILPEARAALEISHPNVCKLHEVHTAETPYGPVDFLTMEFVAGETLADRLKREGPVPAGEVTEIAGQICSGLAQVHRQGLIHGDLKPANIILSRTPEGLARAVLTDFGLAKSKVSGGVHRMSVHGGTLDYMAPELFSGGRASVASDVYALGVLLHAMLTGTAPKRSGEGRLEMQPLPRPWNRIVERCVAPNPDDRLSVDEIHRALNRRTPLARWGLAAALIVIAILAVILWRSREPGGPPVKLAILPVSVEGAPIAIANGLAADLASRVSGLRRNFTVISADEAARNQVDTVEKARSVLGATHVLKTRLATAGARIVAFASVADANSGAVIKELHGDYSAADPATLAKAMLATITGAFRLRSGVPRESVSPAAYEYYVQGIERLRIDINNADEAIPFFEKAIELDPRSALPYAGLAEARIRKFDKGEGAQWLDYAGASIAQAKSINADSVPVLLASGSFHQKQGRYEQAIADYLRATQLEPVNSETWGHLAAGYEVTNRSAEAIATYRKAIEIQPDYFKHHLDLGNFYWDRNQYPEAEQCYRRVTEVAPGLVSGHMNLGLALTQQGKFAAAEQSLQTALKLRRTPRALMNLGGLYYTQERFVEAARFFEESLAAGPPTLIRVFDLADAYRQLGRTTEARDAYRTARRLAEEDLARNPRQAFTRAMLGLIAARLGDSRQAEFELAQAMALDPGKASVIRQVVVAFEALGHRDKALDALRNAPRFLLEELNWQPDAKSLRLDPRFQALVKNSIQQ